ncbi:nucleotidyltransferase family protein [Oceanobacillus sp. CAU 1775]
MLDKRIIEQLRNFGEEIEKIEKIILFGSRAIGDNEKKSDIDLAFVAPTMTAKEWTKFTFILEDELDTLLHLDLIKYEDATDDLRNRIKNYGKQLYPADANKSN